MQTSTHTFKTVKGLELNLDVIRPDDYNPETGIALVHYHGGFLVIGEKITFPPSWLINACMKRKWAYITPSYRLLPEASGLEILSDTVDAFIWTSRNISKNLVCAGSSAGGYLALATALHPNSPTPLAVLSIYGMLDPASMRYVTPGTPLAGPAFDATPILDSIMSGVKGTQQPLTGYAFPANPPTDARFAIISTLHQEAIYLDVLTRELGLGAKVRAEGVEAVSAPFRSLLPVSFALGKQKAPVALVHGDADDFVKMDQSVAVAEKLRELGVKVLLRTPKGQPHGFDVRGVPTDVDLGQKLEDEPPFYEDLRSVLEFLDAAVSVT